jgi:hypothetical protein
MSTRKTNVDINEELFHSVQRVLSTATLEDTIEEAFCEVLRAEAGAKRWRPCPRCTARFLDYGSSP